MAVAVVDADDAKRMSTMDDEDDGMMAYGCWCKTKICVVKKKNTSSNYLIIYIL